MNFKELIPWKRGQNVQVQRSQEVAPFVALHQEMNRLFDDVFRSFDLAPFGSGSLFDGALGWPKIEVSETDSEMKVVAEVPGLKEHDIRVELAHGVLTIKGEKKMESDDKDRLFSERFYGRFERRIPVDEIEEDKVSASFRDGVLTITLPKSVEARRKVKRITIN